MNSPRIKFRESAPIGRVTVFVDGRFMQLFSTYQAAAEWAQGQYMLTQREMLDIYRDYKADYDAN